MNSNSKLFTCDRCEKTFDNVRDLHRHNKMTKTHDSIKRNEHNEVVFECDGCQQVFRSSTMLLRHQKYAKHETEKEARDVSGTVISSTTLAFEKVQDVVHSSFLEIQKEMSTLYTSNGAAEEKITNERIAGLLLPHMTYVNDVLLRETVVVCYSLIKDIDSL